MLTCVEIKLSRRVSATAESWPPRHRLSPMISTTAWVHPTYWLISTQMLTDRRPRPAVAAPEGRVGTGHFIIFILSLNETLEPARALRLAREAFSDSTTLLPLGRLGGPLLAPFSFELVRPVQFVVDRNASRPLGLGRGDDVGRPRRSSVEGLGSCASRVGPVSRVGGPSSSRHELGLLAPGRPGRVEGVQARAALEWRRRWGRARDRAATPSAASAVRSARGVVGAAAARDSLDSLAARISSMRGPLDSRPRALLALRCALRRAARLCLRADADAYVLGNWSWASRRRSIAALSSPSKATPRFAHSQARFMRSSVSNRSRSWRTVSRRARKSSSDSSGCRTGVAELWALAAAAGGLASQSAVPRRRLLERLRADCRGASMFGHAFSSVGA